MFYPMMHAVFWGREFFGLKKKEVSL